mmetsp:Transcript_24173/g.77969  ORF Transcript_24173/g.77969 Transcript_24173/m.77969 type:complete len:273 (+) Transcript_24173:740-1558(+)
MAHRVFRDDRGYDWQWRTHRHPRRRRGPPVSAPRQRTRPAGGFLLLQSDCPLLYAYGPPEYRRAQNVQVFKKFHYHPPSPRGRPGRLHQVRGRHAFNDAPHVLAVRLQQARGLFGSHGRQRKEPREEAEGILPERRRRPKESRYAGPDPKVDGTRADPRLRPPRRPSRRQGPLARRLRYPGGRPATANPRRRRQRLPPRRRRGGGVRGQGGGVIRGGGVVRGGALDGGAGGPSGRRRLRGVRRPDPADLRPPGPRRHRPRRLAGLRVFVFSQ